MCLTLKLLEKNEYSWLKNSDYYSGLYISEETEEINTIYCSKDIENIQIFLKVIDFWGINYIPKEFFKLFLSDKVKSKEALLDMNNYKFHMFLRESLTLENKKIEFPILAIKYDFIDALTYTNKRRFVWNKKTSRFAFECNNLKILSYLLENNCPVYTNIYNYIKINTSVECIKYLHDKGFKWDKNHCQIAAENGNLEVLSYLHENKCPWDKEACSLASRMGHLECLKYLHENGCPWNECSTDAASCMGHLQCLKYLHENGCPWDEYSTEAASRMGHLQCLKYLHENGCPWNECSTEAASRMGHLECLKYLHENGCHWNVIICNMSAQNNHFECLKYAHEHGCPIGKETFSCALKGGGGYNGEPVNWESFTGLLKNNQEKCIIYLLLNRCPMSLNKSQFIYVKKLSKAYGYSILEKFED